MRDVAAACLLVSAAAVAAGLAGLMAEPLRIAGTWLLLASAWLLLSPYTAPETLGSSRRWGLAGLLTLGLLPLAGLGSPLLELLLVAAAAACLAAGRDAAVRRMLTIVSLAALGLWAFQLACRAVPGVWLAADRFAQLLGWAGGWVSSRPLNVGATFAGVELLWLMALLHCGWLVAVRPGRLRRALMALIAVGIVHLGYLFVLGRVPDLMGLLPEPVAPTFEHPYEPPPWQWAAAMRVALPWNLPLLAVVVHAALLGLMWRWTIWPAAREAAAGSETLQTPRRASRSARRGIGWSLAALSAVLPAAALIGWGRADLRDRTLLANASGQLDWDRPVYDFYGEPSAGTFGMLPLLVQSLGGTLRTTDQWSQAELEAADAALLLHSGHSLRPEQGDRILQFVRQGGSLLIAVDPLAESGSAAGGINQLLRATGIQIRRDVAAAETPGWQHSLLLASHPLAAGVDRRSGLIFRGSGSSLRVRWPARPLVVGRWGWSDPGSDAALTGIQRFEPGERLGDLVLAAEQRLGRGRIIVLGNSGCLTNEGGVWGYGVSGRLLHALAVGGGSPLSAPRQLATLALLAGFAVLIALRPELPHLAWVPVLLAISLGASQQVSRHLTRVIPDGRRLAASDPSAVNRVAYIDASHLEAYSDSRWSFDGVDGLALTLMRSGLLPLSLPSLTSERLEGAGAVISIAPARRFSSSQRDLLAGFVRRGGFLICTVGAEDSAAIEPLLDAFGVRVPQSPVPPTARKYEPEPVGRTAAAYLRVERPDSELYEPLVRFHAAWPVESAADGGEILARSPRRQPLAILRQVGRGKLLVVGDTGFAMNKNLEYVGGESFDGAYDNSHFWHWLLSGWLDKEAWIPPPSPEQAAAATEPPAATEAHEPDSAEDAAAGQPPAEANPMEPQVRPATEHEPGGEKASQTEPDPPPSQQASPGQQPSQTEAGQPEPGPAVQEVGP